MLGDTSFAGQNNSRRSPGSEAQDASTMGRASSWAVTAENAPGLDLATYWRLALKYRILILGCFFGALALGAALTLLMTPIYTAQATLQIDREAARVFNSEDVAPREAMIQGEEFFQTQ